MQNKQCMNQSQTWELMDFVDFVKLTELTKKFKLTEKPKLREKEFLPPYVAPIYILSMMSMVWNTFIGQFGLATRLHSLTALVYLLIS